VRKVELGRGRGGQCSALRGGTRECSAKGGLRGNSCVSKVEGIRWCLVELQGRLRGKDRKRHIIGSFI